jgi:uncharacterized protein
MQELKASDVIIDDPFWSPRLDINNRAAIYHQWQELENTRCIDNFRIAAGLKEGFREGWFFSDSDAYKWLDAASHIYSNDPAPRLKSIMDEFIALLAQVQMQDGYIFTYNQLHFPGERWNCLMIEHELYCHGHLIEAAVSHYEATGENTALLLAYKAADLLVKEFLDAPADKTSGHEEIEIALLRLFEMSGHAPYLDLACQFIERRGKVRPFFPLIIQQNALAAKHGRIVREQRQAYRHDHPGSRSFHLPAENYAKKTADSRIRYLLSGLTGKFLQQHLPIRKQVVPVGHAVRFGYMETAVARLYRFNKDETLLPALEQAWDRMVERRMYVTGGIGSLPSIEGFGRDYELDPELAYNETCASLASLFWNWEMTLISGYAKYADLFEWQLYNAAAPGMGLDGKHYLYNNPLASHGGIERKPWFMVPCCPSNLSRTWASMGKYIYSVDENNLWVHQYIGNNARIHAGKWTLGMESGFPWKGNVSILLDLQEPSDFTLHFRLPSWTGKVAVRINGRAVSIPEYSAANTVESTASGFDPRRASYIPLQRRWLPGDRLELDFSMPVELRCASLAVHGHGGKVAMTRGPLVYCLESPDNPGLDIFTACVNQPSIYEKNLPNLLGGILALCGRTVKGYEFTAIPYHLWANRGESHMNVWLNCSG